MGNRKMPGRLRGALALLTILMVAQSALSGCSRVLEGRVQETEATEATTSATTEKKSETTATQPQETTAEAKKSESWPVPVSVSVEDGMRTGFQVDGEWTVEPVWVTAQPFSATGLSVVTDGTGNSGVINFKGEVVVPVEYGYILLGGDRIVAQPSFDSETTTNVVYDLEGREVFRHDGSMNAYSEGMAVFWSDAGNGYLDENGEQAIQLGQGYGEDFRNGIARVYSEYGAAPRYYDLKGTDVTDELSDGIALFSEMGTDKDGTEISFYGYRNADGTTLCEASFPYAEPFIDGTAIVAAGESAYDIRYGLIDATGAFVIEPMYCGIRRLSNGLFAVGNQIDEGAFPPYNYIEYADLALFDGSGKALTDFSLSAAEDFDRNRVMVGNADSVYFVGMNGQRDETLPKFVGQGKMKLDHGLFVGTLDNHSIVANEEGDLLASILPVLQLDDGLLLSTEVSANNRMDAVRYPVVSGLKDKTVEEAVNAAIRKEMTATAEEPTSDGGIVYYNIDTADWSAFRRENLLCVEQDGYLYPLGAAHGMPYRLQLFLDLKTGASYVLDDLFLKDKTDEAYAKMSAAVSKVMKEKMDEVGYWEESTTVERNQPFRLRGDGVMVFYEPYVLASYAAGFSDFEIPFADLEAEIDRNGGFWKALQGE